MKDMGVEVFVGFRERIEDPGARPDRRILPHDLLIAVGGNIAALAFCFAPWMTWQLRKPDTTEIVHGRDTGFVTDGWIVAACCVVAIFAFGLAGVRRDQSLLATVGCVATVLCAVTVFSLWIVIDMAAPAGAESVHAQWGIFATIAASVIASVGAIRAMRTARIY